ncbi:hypothetical protein JHS95_23605 [Vibrio parahaemolyticus]|uniref:hypothetical protein n=1 Tax=Vibrio parahaemolyticus TaxID=670 RepID=UPI001B838392|nr:hypothetical protein [Vibrio parahaemolyticus]UJW96476.1 hypothetical protein JHS95_23605 [Vibrio parahaemolyticus]HBB9944291.1 hypothetical protein [Vibrio parahaemolyticus]HBC3416762.1 hypothetical protein [Vibrio parahaemolyticus]HBC3602244.1 hypothetical protein [Vibrio parahaemolyticus]HBC3878314.1 hypothetical protein [Vibrio parahaemolyticus]
MTLSSSINALFKALVLTVIILAFVATGQAVQYITSAKELRFEAIAHWKLTHPEQSALVEKYVSICLNEKKHELKDLNPPQQPISIYDCGKAIGAHDLVREMQYVDEQLSTLAWPLSFIE